MWDPDDTAELLLLLSQRGAVAAKSPEAVEAPTERPKPLPPPQADQDGSSLITPAINSHAPEPSSPAKTDEAKVQTVLPPCTSSYLPRCAAVFS
jgi:hypothetical protein